MQRIVQSRGEANIQELAHELTHLSEDDLEKYLQTLRVDEADLSQRLAAMQQIEPPLDTVNEINEGSVVSENLAFSLDGVRELIERAESELARRRLP